MIEPSPRLEDEQARVSTDAVSGRPAGRPLQVLMLRWLAVLLLAVSVWTVKPLWVALVLASWFSMLARPLYERLTKVVGGRQRAAGALTVGFVLLALSPLVLIGVSLASEGMRVVNTLSDADSMNQAAKVLVSGTGIDGEAPKKLMEMVQSTSSSVGQTLSRASSAVTAAVVGMVVLVYAFYVFLVHHQRVFRFLSEHSPIPKGDFARVTNAYNETGRGLMIGVGLTAVFQGLVAMIGYWIVGIPHALVLGVLTMGAALIPSVGAALVWGPLAIGLAVTGDTTSALAIVAVGAVASTADNFVRPWLSRRGKLRLPTFVLFIAMLGGMLAFGAWGLVLGPLAVRLGVEVAKILRERGDLGRERPAAAMADAE